MNIKESAMSIDGRLEYESARRKGMRDYNNHRFNGERPHVPVLDTMISKSTIISEVDLGHMEIPLKKIKGTKTIGRATSFAPNFMPILSVKTEFGFKWAHLCEAHLSEGIRDAIKVYEYLNWFYVEEGNKRVSVLKYHEAVMINAHVIRLIPRYDPQDETIKLYYEFLDFYKKTKINTLWLTELDAYRRLYIQMVKNDWIGHEDMTEFDSFYYRFRRMYYELGFDSIKITTGDAFLAYLDIYSAKDDENDMEALKLHIKNLKQEFILLSEKEQIALATDKEALSKKSFLDSLNILSPTMKQASIAFINSKSPEKSAWTYGHEIGRHHLENVFGDRIITTSINHVPEDDSAYDYISKAAETYDIIFTTTPTFLNATLKAALEHKNVRFLNCSENQSYRNVRTYFGRIYEPNFLVGMVAGAMTKTNRLGYVVTYPIPEVISSINAFTLGARFVNPYATVQIKWVANAEEESDDFGYDVDKQLKDMGVDIISHQESSDLTTRLNNSGIYFIQDEEGIPNYLATPVWNWGEFYEKIVNNIMNGSYNRISDIIDQTDRAINYWWGMDTEVVDVIYSSSKLPPEIIQTMNFMKDMIIRGLYHPFRGPIYNQDKVLKVEGGTHLMPEDILTMDWFVDGVIGRIPSVDAYERNHPLLDLASVKKKYE